MSKSTTTGTRKKRGARNTKQEEVLFSRFQEKLRGHFGDDVWDNFLKQLQLVSISETKVTLSTATTFLSKNFVAHYKEKSIEIWEILLKHTVVVKVIVREAVGLHGLQNVGAKQFFGQIPLSVRSDELEFGSDEMEIVDSSMEVRIVLAKARARSFPRTIPAFQIPQETLEYIVGKIESEKQVSLVIDEMFSIWNLTGKIVAGCDLENLIQEDLKSPVSYKVSFGKIDDLVNLTCSYFEVSKKALRKKSQKMPMVRIRQIAMYLAEKLTTSSYADIGRYFQKNRATVIHGCAQIHHLILKEKSIAESIATLTAQFNSR